MFSQRKGAFSKIHLPSRNLNFKGKACLPTINFQRICWFSGGNWYYRGLLSWYFLGGVILPSDHYLLPALVVIDGGLCYSVIAGDNTLPETNSKSHWKIGLLPRKEVYHLPTIDFKSIDLKFQFGTRFSNGNKTHQWHSMKSSLLQVPRSFFHGLMKQSLCKL